MLQITDFLARTISVDSIELSWTTSQQSQSPLDFTFLIERSESISGPYEEISPSFTNKFYYIDNVIPYPTVWRTFYYKLKITDKAANSEYAGPVYVGKIENLHALEIARLERIAFKQVAGTRLYVLPVKTFGEKCGCYDSITGKRLTQRCRTCFDSGFSGGYMDAVETYGQIGVYTKHTRNIPSAGGVEIEPITTTIRLVNYPIVKRSDIILDIKDNTRWRVVTVTAKKLGGCLISQDIQAVLVDTSNIVYEIELKNLDIFQVLEPPMLRKRETSF